MLKTIGSAILLLALVGAQAAPQLRNKSPGTPSRGSEEVSKCDAVLVPDITLIQSNLTVLASFLRIVDETNFQQYKQQYSASFPDYFSGDYQQFDEARRHYYQKESLNIELYEAKSVLQSVVSNEKVNAWLQCITSTNYGLFTYVNDVTEDGATLKVQWVPPAGLAKLTKPKLALDQATAKPNNFDGAKEFVGSAEIILRRSAKGDWVRGTASGFAGDGGAYSARFFIAQTPKPQTITVDESGSPSMLFETRYMIPKSPLPKDVEFTVESNTTQTGEFFTQCCRFIQQYTWVGGTLTYDSGEVGDFGEHQVKTLSHSQKVTVKAGTQIEIRVRNNGKGAKIGATTLRWTGQYTVLK